MSFFICKEMKQLELKHIAPYLPYGLKVKHESIDEDVTEICNLESLSLDCITFDNGCDYYFEDSDYDNPIIKPLLRPLSDLYKDIDGEVGIVELAKMLGDFKELLSVSVEDNAVDYMGNPAPYYECKYVSDIDDDIHSTLVFCPDTVSFERLIIYNVHLTRPVSASDLQNTPIRCYNQFYEYLFQHHYDVYSLIDKGLAIDLNKK